METAKYSKSWLVTTSIARGLLGTENGERLPTIKEYSDIFCSSRGVIQNALSALQHGGAVTLDIQGKKGTFLKDKNEEKLFKHAGLKFITGSMPAPLNTYLAGLASGICQAMGGCPVPFTFAFVQGGKTRVDALSRGIYDFVVVTQSTAEKFTRSAPHLEIAFSLDQSLYSQPYMLYLNRPGLSEIEPGMRLAADPASTDQWELTQLLCQDKQVEIVQRPYVSASVSFLSGEVDGVVYRGDLDVFLNELYSLPFTMEKRISRKGVSVVPIAPAKLPGFQLPVVLVNKKEYGMSGVIRRYLNSDVVAYIQKQVIGMQMAPRFF